MTLRLAATLGDRHAALNLHLRARRYHPLEAAGPLVGANAARREHNVASLAARVAEP
jgi:hypothetical protein